MGKYNYPNDFAVALSLIDATPVYFRAFSFSNDEVQIINPATGEVTAITPASFRARYVPRWECPPALQEKARAVPEYREWRKARGEAQRGNDA